MNKQSTKAAYDTSDSFYSSPEFNYHHKKTEYQCRIILDNRQRAIDSLLANPNITKQQLEDLINYLQKDTDVMISQLVTEATELRQKLRTQKTSLETVIRQLRSKVRSLSGENLQMTAELQMKQRGMQRLLSEYQNQLQKKEKQTVHINQQLEEKSAFCQHAKKQIIAQTTEIEQLKYQLNYWEREYSTQKIINSAQKNDPTKSLLQKERMMHNEASDRECLIRCLNQEGVRKDKEIDNLSKTVVKLRSELQNEKNNRVVEKNKQNSDIQKLQCEAAINSIKTKYKLKLQKTVQMVSRKLNKLRSQLEVVKTSAVKQMQLCYKFDKAIINDQLKVFCSK